MLGAIIFMGLISLGLISLGIYLLKSTEYDALSLTIFILALFCVVVIIALSTAYATKSHHDELPTINDVPKNAHVDTITVLRNDSVAEVRYEICWNDGE